MFLGVLLALVVFTGGCVALLAVGFGSAIDEADRAITEQREAVQADVDGCEVTGVESFDESVLSIRCRVTNNSADRSNYTFSVGATVDGQRYGTTAVIVDNVRSGETATATTSLWPDDPDTAAPDPAAVELEVFDVTRWSAEG